MQPLNTLVRQIIELRERGLAQVTLLAACPNSAAVLEAAVLVAAQNNMPMLFAATLNQVDQDGGYTGWTASTFVKTMRQFAQKHACSSPLYACLDHGGPWLKDRHTLDRLSFEQTLDAVKQSITACLEAEYQLLHIDPTVDRTLPSHTPVPIDLVVERTLDLIGHAEAERQRLGQSPIAYEVGTEEVHGGLVDLDSFRRFITGLRQGLEERSMVNAWPCFIVGKVGTDLHTTDFDPIVAGHLLDIVAPYGSLIKGHYTDRVANPEDYPTAGMGGANVGPEFTAAEYDALADLVAKEEALCKSEPATISSALLGALEDAVFDSGRWKKWLQPDEENIPFAELTAQRRGWLVETGARYVWTDERVEEARRQLYVNLSPVLPDPHRYVVDRIAGAIDHYVNRFHLFNANQLFDHGSRVIEEGQT